MEVTANSRITARFYRSGAAMIINPTGAAYLKMPKCIQFLEKDDFKQIIVRPCEMGEPDSYPILGKHYSYAKGGIAVRSTTFVFKIWGVNNWDKDSHYFVYGKIDPNQPVIQNLVNKYTRTK